MITKPVHVFLAFSVAAVIFSALPGQAQNNTSLLIDAVTTNFAGANLTIGSSGTNNSLIIRNGGVVTNVAIGAIGSGAGGNFNFGVVTNTDSAWYTTGEVRVGATGGSSNN